MVLQDKISDPFTWTKRYCRNQALISIAYSFIHSQPALAMPSFDVFPNVLISHTFLCYSLCLEYYPLLLHLVNFYSFFGLSLDIISKQPSLVTLPLYLCGRILLSTLTYVHIIEFSMPFCNYLSFVTLICLFSPYGLEILFTFCVPTIYCGSRYMT
jgi:hypothetical protein